MFDHTSRYYNIKDARYTTADGRHIVYKCRRILPQGDMIAKLAEIKISAAERIDQVNARALGSPEQYWRLCDANNAMNPFDLTAHPPLTLKVPNPQAGGNQ